MRTALIAGATGLIGGQLLTRLLANDQYQKVIAFTRDELPIHPKLIQLKIDGEKMGELDSGSASMMSFAASERPWQKPIPKRSFTSWILHFLIYWRRIAYNMAQNNIY